MNNIKNHWLPLGFISIGLLCTALSGFGQLPPKFERNVITTNVNATSTNAGNLFVNKGGSDSTGLRGNSAFPFLTITAAKVAASAGDTIRVSPGTYDETDLAKANVNFYFEPGANVRYTGASQLAFFNVTNGSTTVGGHGSFTNLTAALVGSGGGIIHQHGGLLNFSGENLVSTNASRAAIYQTNGVLKLNAAHIAGHHGVYWIDGDCHITAHTITNSGPQGASAAGVWAECNHTTTQFVWLDVKHLSSLYTASHISARLWLYVEQVGSIEANGGRTYVNAQKASSVLAGTGELWGTIQKVSGSSTIPVQLGGAGFWLDILQIEDPSNLATEMVRLGAVTAPSFLRGLTIKSGTGAAGIFSEGYPVTVEGFTVDSSAADRATVELSVDGEPDPTLVLKNVRLIASGTNWSITDLAATGTPKVSVGGTLQANNGIRPNILITNGWLEIAGRHGIGTNAPAAALHVGNGGSAIVDGTVTAASFVGSGTNSANLHLGSSNAIGGISFQPAHNLPVNITNIFNFTNVTAGQTLCVESSNNWTVVWGLCEGSSPLTNVTVLGIFTNSALVISNGSATGPGVLHICKSTNGIIGASVWQVNLTNGNTGILKAPTTALDVFGTATASFFSGGQYQINGVEAVGSSGFALRLGGGAWTHIALGTTNVPVGVGSSAATAKLHVNSGSNEFMLKLSSPVGDHITVRTNAITLLTNMSLAFQAGGNQRLGSATLVNGTVTVGNTAVTANTKVMAWFSAVGGTTAGILTGSVVAGTSFTITSVGATGTTVSTDTSVVNYLLIDNP